MADPKRRQRWPLNWTTLIAGGLVVAGLFLTSISWWFFLLTAIGTFGPGILREFGVLHDRDEFQRRAEYRAGYFAFVITGLVAFLFVAFIRSGGMFEHPERLPSFLLTLLWLTWFFSSLLAYWGPQQTAARVLYTFGTVWLIFTILSNLGSEWTGWAALLLHPLLAAPFFGLGCLAGRRPHLAGVLLLLAFIAAFVLFEVPKITSTGSIVSLVDDGGLLLFLGPLLASGVALLGVGKEDNEDEDEDPQA